MLSSLSKSIAQLRNLEAATETRLNHDVSSTLNSKEGMRRKVMTGISQEGAKKDGMLLPASTCLLILRFLVLVELRVL